MNWKLLGRSLLTVASCALLGGAVLVGYFYFQSERTDQQRTETIEQVKEEVAQAEALDMGAIEFEKVQELARGGKWDAVRGQCERILREFPQSARAPDARRIVSQMNFDALLSRDPYPGKAIYTVKSGDSIAAIAQRHQCSYAFVVRVSGLERAPNIQPNDQLVVCPLNFRLRVNLPQSLLEVYELPEGEAGATAAAKPAEAAQGAKASAAVEGAEAEGEAGAEAVEEPGRLFAALPIMAARLPQSLPARGLAVGEVVGLAGDKRLPSFDGGFATAPKEVTLGSGVALRGLVEGEEPTRTGLYLRPADLEDLALILRRGQKVELLREEAEKG